MVHGRDMALDRSRFSIVGIKVLGFFYMVWYDIQGIDICIVDSTEQFAVKSTNNHDFIAMFKNISSSKQLLTGGV